MFDKERKFSTEVLETFSGEFFSDNSSRQGYNESTGDGDVDENDGGVIMDQVSRKQVVVGILLGLLLVMSACTRSVTPTEAPQATEIDLFPQQTETAMSLAVDTPVADSPPEEPASETQPAPQATETPAVQATETPLAATSTPKITEETQESSTGNALIVTQTVSPVSIPPAGGDTVQWAIENLAAAPNIDGDIGDWPGVIYAIDKIVFGPEFYANQIDLFGEFKLGWDAQYLYIGVLVRDSRFVQTATDDRLFQGDSIELLLDMDRNGDPDSQELSADDYQLGFSPGNLEDIPVPVAYLWAPTDQEGVMSSALVQGRLTDDGYMVEIAIAWQELGLTPTAGMTFGLLLSVSDNDTIGKNEQQTVISISETRDLTNPTTWIPVVLAGP
jgi:hypothetical protein